MDNRQLREIQKRARNSITSSLLGLNDIILIMNNVNTKESQRTCLDYFNGQYQIYETASEILGVRYFDIVHFSGMIDYVK